MHTAQCALLCVFKLHYTACQLSSTEVFLHVMVPSLGTKAVACVQRIHCIRVACRMLIVEVILNECIDLN